jgi:ribosome-associated toxin RatA of RatAB toxin-antitoxin module
MTDFSLIVVELVNEQKAYVKFMTPCQTKGVFKRPSKEDKQLVDVKFALMKGFSPDWLKKYFGT